MPPVALTCLKYAAAPQLSVSPICAYGPASARSPQATMGELLLAALPPPELHAARVPASRTVAAAAVTVAALVANGIRLRIIGQPPYRPTRSEFTTGEARKSAGPPSKARRPPDSTKIR